MRYGSPSYLYTGQWKDGRRNGVGTLISEEYESKSQGIWRDEKLVEGTIDTKPCRYKIMAKGNGIVGELISSRAGMTFRGSFYYTDNVAFYQNPTQVYANPHTLKPAVGQVIEGNTFTFSGTIGEDVLFCGEDQFYRPSYRYFRSWPGYMGPSGGVYYRGTYRGYHGGGHRGGGGGRRGGGRR